MKTPALLLPLCLLLAARAGADTWAVQTLDTNPDGAWGCSLALDAAGPHISYVAGSILKYAEFDGNQWFLSELDPVVDNLSPTSLALHQGDPRIAYGKGNWQNQDLKYAYRIGSTWSIGTALSTGSPGAACSLAIDPSNGQPHIACVDSLNKTVLYASNVGFGWSSQEIAANVGPYAQTALALGTEELVIVHTSENGSGGDDIKVAVYNDVGWNTYDLETSLASSARLDVAIGPDGPHILYCSAWNTLRHAYRSGGAWVSEDVPIGGQENLKGASLAIAADGHPAIVCAREAPDDASTIVLHYARREADGWKTGSPIETWAKIGGDVSCSLAHDTTGAPCVAYTHGDGSPLYYATRTAVDAATPSAATPAAPTVKIAGRRKLVTTNASVRVKGTATGAVTKVTLANGRKSVKVAGTASWRATVRLKPGRNKLTATAIGPGGTSAPARIVITRN